MAAGTVPTSEAEAEVEPGVEPSRRVRRHQATKARIVEAAWEVARARGPVRHRAARPGGPGRPLPVVAVLVLRLQARALRRDVRRRLRRLLDEVGRLELDGDPRQALKQVASFIVRVFADDIPRSQLLFTRTIPGFDRARSPTRWRRSSSPRGGSAPRAAGLTRPHDMDLYTALVAGLAPSSSPTIPAATAGCASWRGDRHVARPRPDARGGDDHDATGTDVTTIPRIGHDEAMRITAVEFDRMLALFRGLGPRRLGPPDRQRPVGRAGDGMLHLLGAAEANASFRESVHQMHRASASSSRSAATTGSTASTRSRSASAPASPTTRSSTGTRRPRPAAVKARRRIPAPIRALPLVDIGPSRSARRPSAT